MTEIEKVLQVFADSIEKLSYPEPTGDPNKDYAGFWPIIEKEEAYHKQCEMTPIWY